MEARKNSHLCVAQQDMKIQADCKVCVKCCCLEALAATKGATRKLMKPCCEPGRFTWSSSYVVVNQARTWHYCAPSPCRLTSQSGFQACSPANSPMQLPTAIVIAVLLVALLEELVQDTPSPSTANVERLPRKSAANQAGLYWVSACAD